MTKTSLSLLVANPCCLFFGSKCASPLKTYHPQPRRHAETDVGSGVLKFLVFGFGRQHAHQRVSTIFVGQRRATAHVLAGCWPLASFRLGCHGLNYAIETTRSSLSYRVDMVMLTPWQPTQRSQSPNRSSSPRRANSAADRSPSVAGSASSALATSFRHSLRRPTRTRRRTSSTSSSRAVRAQTTSVAGSRASTTRRACSGSRGRAP